MSEKITNFKTQTKMIEPLRQEIDAALKAIGEKYGISIKAGNASYNAEMVCYKLECTTMGENGEVETKEAKDFKAYAFMYGMKADDLGKTFKMGRDSFTINGLKPRSRNAVIAKKVGTTQNYKFDPEMVKQALKMAEVVTA
jgi:hypothetical protein